VGAEDERLEKEVLNCQSRKTKVAFWDVDAPATLARTEGDAADPFRKLIPHYYAIFTYGGGPHVISHYRQLGARLCMPIYNALDPETHYPVIAEPELVCDLAFVGHRLPVREARVEEFFLNAAASAPDLSFVLGGEGWGDKKLPANVRWIGHVASDRHNVVNCSARMVLNINRDSMAKVGFSPPTRVFEAAGAGACVITDAWEGIEQFFTPDSEILCAASGEEVITQLRRFNEVQSIKIGSAMLLRAMHQHTYELRAREVDAALQKLFVNRVPREPVSSRVASYIVSHLPV